MGAGSLPALIKTIKMRALLVLASVFVLVSCDDPLAPDPLATGLSYFPLEVGTYRSYQINSITYSQFAPNDTVEFQLKETVVDSFLVQDQAVFVLHRFNRLSSEDPWELDSVWTARRNQNHAVVVENNVPFLKMVFPLRINKTWDGNLLNTMPEDEYEITEVEGQMDVTAGSFAPVMTIFENNDPDTLIFQDIRKSVYAPEIGLIYKMSSILNFCNLTPDCLGTLESGIKFEQMLIDYGK